MITDAFAISGVMQLYYLLCTKILHFTLQYLYVLCVVIARNSD